MKELQKGVLTGMELESSACFNTILTIDRNTKRVYQSYTKTKDADHYDQIRSGTCGILPRTQVLMNCTAWPGIRANKRGQSTPPRYCDFSSSSDKSQDATAGTVSSAPQHWWQGAPIVAPAPQPAPTAQRGLSDCEVGIGPPCQQGRPNNTAVTKPPFDPSKPYWELDPVTNQWHRNPGTNKQP